MKTELLNETSIYVTDLETAERFYESVIGLEVAQRVEGRGSTLRHDDFTLVLFQATTTAIKRVGVPPGSHEFGRVSIGICPTEVSPWREHLERHEVPIEGNVVWPDGTQSITCRDPDGNRVELKTQPARSQAIDEGQRRSQAISQGLHAQWKLFQAAHLGVTHRQGYE